MKTVTFAVCTLALGLTHAMAQEIQQRRESGTKAFIAHESGPEGVIKGAPFSAETYTEFRQTLGDGNVIERKNRGAMYRDSEGRVRTEQVLRAGLAAGSAEGGEIVIIRDPVAAVHWILNPALKTAAKMQFGPGVPHASMEGPVKVPRGGGGAPGGIVALERMPGGGGGAPGGIMTHERMPGGGGAVAHAAVSEQNVNREKLGLQNINGVQAEGTRVTTTIPAGQTGNVRPIEIVSERWYSPQLQMVVKTRHSDPRTGDHVFEMTNIRQGEPAASLFQVPADYQVKEGRVEDIRKKVQQLSDSEKMRRAPAVPRDEM